MKPELHEMTFKQLIDEATWAVVQQMINGTARDGVIDAINLYGAWRDAAQAPRLEVMAKEAAMYRFWRDMACSNPIIVAKALAPCLTPESIDAALRDLMALKQGDEE